MNDGLINVDHNFPVFAQLFNIIAPIINLMSGEMKQFLGILGVVESKLSTFCNPFENINEVRKAFLSYCLPRLHNKQNPEINDKGEKLNEKSIEK